MWLNSKILVLGLLPRDSLDYKTTIEYLEEIYQKNRYLTNIQKKTISVEVGMSPKQIQYWFQNRRKRGKPKILTLQWTHTNCLFIC